MQVEEAKKAKREAELKILEVVSEFQKATGLDVSGIGAQSLDISSLGQPPSRTVVDVHLDCSI